MENSTVLNNISIAKIKALGFSDVYAYQDKLIVSDRIDHLDLFKFPCRVDGIVLFLCTKGSLSCAINLKPYKISEGDLLVNFTSDIIQMTGSDGFEGYASLVSYEYLEALQVDFRSRLSFYLGVKHNAIASLKPDDSEAMEMYFKLLRKYAVDGNSKSDEIINRIIQALGLSVISLMNDNEHTENIAPIPDLTQGRSEQTFEKFMGLLTQTRARERGVKFYADQLHLTPNYLSGLIKNYSGKSAVDWINDYAVTEAKMLLRFSDLNIQELSYQLNFPSQSAFGKYFKQYTGLSPKEYRKSCV